MLARMLHPLRLTTGSLVVWLGLAMLHWVLTYWPQLLSQSMLRWAAAVELVLWFLLGLSIMLMLPRALRWRLRRSVRASPEVVHERQRIARDLHDHLGPQLVRAMELLDPEVPAQRETRGILEQCMLDLRLAVDSLGADEGSLTDRLARLRHRMLPAMQRRGMAMDWHLDCPDGVPEPCGEAAAHLGAIAQEALSNVLQHAQATRVAVRLECGALGWCLEVRDNGVGAAHTDGSTVSGQGRGLHGMHQRAQQAGGLLSVIRPTEGGTCIRVLVPHAGPLAQGEGLLRQAASLNNGQNG
jgi:two-component system sensor histidine kinase DevS